MDNGIQHTKYTENPKYEDLRMLLMELKGGLIFTQFKPDVGIVAGILKELNKNHVAIYSDMSEKKKDEEIENFKQAKYDFLVVHAKTGGTGLHITHTNNMLYYALPESYIVYDQSKYRAMRLGQDADYCNIYSFITKGTVEKQKLVKNLVNKARDNNEEYKIYRRK